MANSYNQQNKTQSGTSIQHVKQQNAGSAGSSGQYGTEFSSQTDVQQVKKLNQQAEANKSQASGKYGQNSSQ
ncbi:MAG: gamma-type small acid-soluble spore protein [Bacillus sp. (in: firmicutes)]